MKDLLTATYFFSYRKGSLIKTSSVLLPYIYSKAFLMHITLSQAIILSGFVYTFYKSHACLKRIINQANYRYKLVT